MNIRCGSLKSFSILKIKELVSLEQVLTNWFPTYQLVTIIENQLYKTLFL